MPPEQLAAVAAESTRAHLLRRPRENPVGRFAATFADSVGQLTPGDELTYHRYAFATLRQLGSAADMGAHHLRWLQSRGVGAFEATATSLASVSLGCKSLILKGARAVVTGKRGDFTPLLGEIDRSWSTAMDGLSARFGV